MICPTCRGRGFVPLNGDDDEARHGPCPECLGGGIVSLSDAAGAYGDATVLERNCDHCGKPYCGPAVYCSLACALADG
jgi:hypothetical protein